MRELAEGLRLVCDLIWHEACVIGFYPATPTPAQEEERRQADRRWERVLRLSRTASGREERAA